MAIFYNPYIVRSGLILCLDAGNTKSYTGSGTTFTDISGAGNHHVVAGSPSFSNGRFTLDGSTQGFTRASTLTGATNNNTVVIWYSTTDTQELWVQGNNNGSFYLSASASNNYYHGNAGAPTNYVDLNTVVRPDTPVNYRNGAFHMWEAKGVDFTSWSSFQWFLYGSGWQLAGTVGAILVYNRIITAAESAANFEAFRGRFGV